MGHEPIVIEILGTALRVNTDEDPQYLSALSVICRKKLLKSGHLPGSTIP